MISLLLISLENLPSNAVSLVNVSQVLFTYWFKIMGEGYNEKTIL